MRAAGPAPGGPPSADAAQAGAGRAGGGRAGADPAELSPAGPGSAGPGSAGPGSAGPGSAGPNYVSKTDLVAALIRELIITGELAAGEPLRQRDLAERFRVSQTPVREAMRRLESEGLVRGDAHRGFTVVEPEDGPVEENFQIRAALESLGAALAARKIDAKGIARLQALNDRMRALADDDPSYADLNREFHFTVYEHAGSPLLLTLMRLLWASLQGGPRVSRTHAESARQHDAILAALKAGDPDEASARTYQHIMSATH
jgi:DNA-binding GntR family transcriptional regulator